MPVSGWKYLKLGQCTNCHEAGARLFVPVLDGTRAEDHRYVNGEHIPHFDPVCKKCTQLYSLDIICTTHKLPLRVEFGMCKLCRPASKGRYTPTGS